MRADDLRDVLHQADADVTEATRLFLAERQSIPGPPSVDGLVVFHRDDVLRFMGYLTTSPPGRPDLEIAQEIETWLRDHNLVDRFEEWLGG